MTKIKQGLKRKTAIENDSSLTYDLIVSRVPSRRRKFLRYQGGLFSSDLGCEQTIGTLRQLIIERNSYRLCVLFMIGSIIIQKKDITCIIGWN